MKEATQNAQGTSSRRLQVPAYPGRSLSIIVPVGLLVGLALGIAFFALKNEPAAVPAAPEENQRSDLHVIYAPARTIQSGARLERADFREIVVHESEIPTGSVEDAQTVFGQYAKIDLERGKPIQKGTVSRMPTFKTLLASIPIGFRGITIAVDATGGIEGWSKPGAHVDVIACYFDKRNSKKTTITAVEDAVVLSFNGVTTDMIEAQVGQQKGQQPPGGVPQSATVTLSVPLKDALRIQTAKMMGSLSLILRNPHDNLPSKKKVATPEDLRRMLPVNRNIPVVTAGLAKTEALPPVSNPDGFARYHARNGEVVEMELFAREWKRSGDASDNR